MATPAYGRVTAGIALAFSSSQELLQIGQELYHIIARRAYQLYERRGRSQGMDISDWLQAESEIIGPCRHIVAESPACLMFRVELPGTFSANQIKVSVEPRQVIVSAQREVMADISSSNGHITKLVPQRLFHIENLPVAVDPSRSRTTLGFERLEIEMLKIGVTHPEGGCSPERGNRPFHRFRDAYHSAGETAELRRKNRMSCAASEPF